MAESKVVSLMLVDDHVLFREGLRKLIGHWGEFQVIGEASNGQEALELCRQEHPDLVLMDIQMPVMDGIEAAGLIHAEFPFTAVVMLTVSMEESDLFEAFRQGARGYLLKNISAPQLRERLHEVNRGEVPLPGAIAARILAEFNNQQTSGTCDPLEPLIAHEVQILQLVAEGLSNEEIGARLSMSGQMVKKHLSNAMEKLHLNNRVQAAVYAVRKGLVDR